MRNNMQSIKRRRIKRPPGRGRRRRRRRRRQKSWRHVYTRLGWPSIKTADNRAPGRTRRDLYVVVVASKRRTTAGTAKPLGFTWSQAMIMTRDGRRRLKIYGKIEFLPHTVKILFSSAAAAGLIVESHLFVPSGKHAVEYSSFPRGV